MVEMFAVVLFMSLVLVPPFCRRPRRFDERGVSVELATRLGVRENGASRYRPARRLTVIDVTERIIGNLLAEFHVQTII
jgi:hypothetical protein